MILRFRGGRGAGVFRFSISYQVTVAGNMTAIKAIDHTSALPDERGHTHPALIDVEVNFRIY